MSGLSVYSMAVGGYGAFQYRAMLGEALSLRPSRLILALYPLNDAADLCASQRYVTCQAHWEQVTGLPWATCGARGVNSRERDDAGRLTDRLSEDVALISAARDLYGRARTYARLRGLTITGERGEVLIGASGARYLFSRTTMTARAAMVDMSDPRVESGAQQLETLLIEARAACDGIGATVSVLFIPSRERVLRPAPTWETLRQSVTSIQAGEARLVSRLARRAEALGIETSDAGVEMEEVQSRGARLYPDGEDDHPLVAGQRAFALAALRLLRVGKAPSRDGRALRRQVNGPLE